MIVKQIFYKRSSNYYSCLTTRMTLQLLVVLSAVARAALPTAMTTVIAPDEHPIFHLLMPHLNDAVSSRLDGIV